MAKEIVANYGDGSGVYTIIRDDNILTVTISTYQDEVFEEFSYVLVRAPHLDDKADWEDYKLTDEFYSCSDDPECVRINGEAFLTEWVDAGE